MRLFEILGEDEDKYYIVPVERTWFNAATGEEIRVPKGSHHTKFVVNNPDLFNLSNEQVDLITDKDEDYSDNVADLVFDNNWVRVAYSLSHSCIWVSAHFLPDLQKAAKEYVFDNTDFLTVSTYNLFAELTYGQINRFINTGKLPQKSEVRSRSRGLSETE